MKPISRLVIAAGILFVLAQLVRPVIPTKPAAAEVQVPPAVKQILERSCYSCHSDERRLAWFDQIEPGYLIVRHDILTARSHLDFSTLGSAPPAMQRAKLFEAVNMIQLGAMPLQQFLALHPNARLSAPELAELKAYLAPWGTAPSLSIIAHQKDARSVIPPSGAALPISLSAVSPERNGLPFDPSFENWKPLSTTDRGDNNTFRFVLGNDIAVKAAQSGNIAPWPDGTRFAKVAWQQGLGADELIHPGKFVQVELMVKDARLYKDTDGWGWGRWRGLELKPYGDDAHFVEECSLSLVSDGWEAVYCQSPGDFFKMYDSRKKQIFIADDAFGRTEYDPTRASIWEAELDLVLHRLDVSHWLIWTSRKHILERAVNRMDVAGKARSFPEPGAVLVDASLLSIEERALVLFRHARAAGLEQIAKDLVRRHASKIVMNRDFTPERIRRFVNESLPLIAARARSGTLTRGQISAQIDEAIKNPTKQMQLTFRGLPVALKWYLVSMLEIPQEWRLDGRNDLEQRYLSYCPDEKRISFEEATQQLHEAFIRVRKRGRDALSLDWIHPSYRDLVIDELAVDSDLRTQFLKRASLEGFKLAVSDTGGREGLRRLPFVLSKESWDFLRERALAIVRDLDKDRDLLEILTSAAKRSNSIAPECNWEELISRVCCAVKGKWDAGAKHLEAADLAAFRGARSAINSNQDFPEILGTWLSLEQEFRKIFSVDHSLVLRDLKLLDELARFAEEAEACAPGFLGRRGFPAQFELTVEPLFERAKRGFSDLRYSFEDDIEDDRGEFSSEVSQLAGVFDRMSRIPTSDGVDGTVKGRPARLGGWADELQGMAYAFRSDEPEFVLANDREHDSDEERALPTDDFDIGALFAEL